LVVVDGEGQERRDSPDLCFKVSLMSLYGAARIRVSRFS
jgi:hypothetical protein